MVDDIPEMNLPNLEDPYLTAPPKSKATRDACICFKNLKMPVLDTLQLLSVNPEDLSSMRVAPKQLLGLIDLQITDPAGAKAAASKSCPLNPGLEVIPGHRF